MRNLSISMVANFIFWWTKQIFFLLIKLEPRISSWLQPRKNNFVPTELDVSFSANDNHYSSSRPLCNFTEKKYCDVIELLLIRSFWHVKGDKLNSQASQQKWAVTMPSVKMWKTLSQQSLCWSVLDFWKIKFDKLDFLVYFELDLISKLIFAG